MWVVIPALCCLSLASLMLLWAAAEWLSGRPLVFARSRVARGEGLRSVRWRASGGALWSVVGFAQGAAILIERAFPFRQPVMIAALVCFVVMVGAAVLGSACLLRAEGTRVR